MKGLILFAEDGGLRAPFPLGDSKYWNNINQLTKKEYENYIKILRGEFIE